MQQKSLRQILTWVSCIGLLPMALLLALLIYQGQHSAREEAIADLNGLTQALSKQFELQIADAEYSFQSLGGVETIQNGSQAACEAWLAKNMPIRPGVNTWFRLAPDGTVTCANQPHGESDRLDATFDPGNPNAYNIMRVSPARESASTGNYVIALTKSYWNDGAPFQLLVTLDVDWFLKAALQYVSLQDRRIFIVGQDGQMLLQLPNYRNTTGARVPTYNRIAIPENSPLLQEVKSGVNGDERYVSNVVMHRFDNGLALYLSVSASPAVINAEANWFILLGLGTLVLAVGGVVVAQRLLFGRYLAKPISAIVAYSTTVAGGKVAADLVLPKRAPRELFDMAQAVTSMANENQDRSAALSEALQNLERAQDIAKMGHWRIDLTSNTLEWSDGVYKLHELTRDSFQPTVEKAIELYHPEDRDDVNRSIADAMRLRQPFEFEKRIVRSDGSFLYTSSRGQLTFNSHGEPIAMFGTIIDIDAPKQAQRELKRAQRAAQQLADARASFVASVTHEVRTPLTAMLGIVDGFRHEEALTPEQVRQVDLLEASGQMLMNVISDLLDSASVDAGAIRLAESSADPVALVDGCYAIFQTAYRSTGVRFTQKTSGQAPDKAVFDAQRMRQILFNLLGNAFKHTREGEISLETEFHAESMAVSVRDTGPGIAESKQRYIFERFNNGSANASVQRPGTGLGLSIVKAIVEQMGGTISVVSQPGQGSCFTVTIPFKAAEVAEQNACVPQPSEKRSGQVLLVEDNPVNQKLLMAFLKKIGCSFVVQNDGQYAVEWLLAQRQEDLPVLALIDVNMPRLNGIELCEFIRKQLPGGESMPLYLVTADVIAGHDNAIKQLEINGTVPKPIDFSALREVVQAYVAPQRVQPAA